MTGKTRGHWFVVALLLVLLPACRAQDSSKPIPETALLSFDRYTNAFFGFSIPLPPDPRLGIAQLPPTTFWHLLFGLGEQKSRTAFIISARPMTEHDARHEMWAYSSITIRGQEFAEGAVQPDKHDVRQGHFYLTFLDSYLLKFKILSLDPAMAKEIERCVEQIEFFDPAKAKEIAGPNGKPYNPLTQVGARQ